MATTVPTRIPEARQRPAGNRHAAAIGVSRVPPRTPTHSVQDIEKVCEPQSIHVEEPGLPSLLEEVEMLTKSYEALEASTTPRNKSRQARTKRTTRRSRKTTGVKQAQAVPDMPVYSSVRSRASRETRQASSEATSSGTAAAGVPATGSHSSMSVRRTQKSRAWGRAKERDDMEAVWNEPNEPSPGNSLSSKQEQELTSRLQRYYKLKDRFDALSSKLGYAPDMVEFAMHLGTDRVSAVTQIMNNGPKQKNAMVTYNMGLVYNICKKYDHPDVSAEELRSAAVEGLVRATKLFDPSKGFKFSTYAHWWIRQAVAKALSVQGRVMYVPQNVYDLSVQVKQAAAELAPEYGSAKDIPDDALAERVGITVKRLRDVQLSMRDPVSLNAPMKADGDTQLQETIEDSKAVRSEDILITESIEQAIEEYLQGLPTRDAAVLKMRYGICEFDTPHTLEEIGVRFQVTRERIRQIEVKALNFLRRSSFCDEMADFAMEQEADLVRSASSVAKKQS